MEYDPALVESGYWEADGAYDATLRLLDRTSGITAVYAQNDSMAQGVLSAARAGLGMPEDCAVVGCDDIPIAAHTNPPLTTVHVPLFETGETAVRLLLDRISGEATNPRPTPLPVRLVRPASCDAGEREETPSNDSLIGEE